MAYAFADSTAKTRKASQYYEMLGSRAIWADGWTAVTWHKKDTPWEEDKWELYHTDADITESIDLAAKYPEKLKELQELWFAEARKYNVLPLDDRRYERAADPTRPVAALAKKKYTFYPGTSILHPLAAPQLLEKEHTITAHVDIPTDGAEGVLACSGGEFGGWTLFLKDGKFHYVQNYLKLGEAHVSSPRPLSPGKHTLGIHFTPGEKHLKPGLHHRRRDPIRRRRAGCRTEGRQGRRPVQHHDRLRSPDRPEYGHAGVPRVRGAPFRFTGKLGK